MSVRQAELLMAIALALLSIVFMIKSTDGLSIWWVPEKGPGSGAWPFWLSLLMLLSCLTIIVRWVMRVTPQSRSEEPFMDRHAVQLLGTTVAALFLLILGMRYIGIYFSLVLFLIFYLRVLGRHSWALAVSLAGAIPVAVFMLFEWALTIPLPKGMSERLFFPIYKLMYSRGPGIWPYLLALLLACLTITALQYWRARQPRPATGGTFVGSEAVQAFGTAAAIVLLALGTGYVGIYVALLLFEIVYLKVLARQSWLVSVVAMLAVPIAVFLIFELALGIEMPKGLTAPLFG